MNFILRTVIIGGLLTAQLAKAQSLQRPWSGHSHDPQHTAISSVAAQPMNQIKWKTAVDLFPQYSGSSLLIHYGSPLVTRSNTVIVPVKTGVSGGFAVKALVAATGATNWSRASDYVLPSYNWTPSFSPTLTPKGRLYFPGGGGTVYYCDTPDTTNAAPAIGQIAFYGLTNYLANTNAYLANVKINTPITSDRYGNIFFGFLVTGSTPLNLTSGLARIDSDGTGISITASTAAGSVSINRVAMNCAPALNNNHRILYVGVCSNYTGYGFLVGLDSRTLAPLHSVRFKDVMTPANDARVYGDSTSSPTVGPDGDVYFGVLGNPVQANNYRGWMLHFDGTLSQTKVPGAFGWDHTASIIPAALVPSYTSGSPYLIMTKYNNYAGAGDGVNRLAILDPQNSMTDPISGATVMKEVFTIAGPTPDVSITNSYPNAVREWCINTAAVDPFSKSVMVNSEDGKLYRWDLTTQSLVETNTLTDGIFEAYTPTIIGVDGTVYAINNATLFAVGQ